MRLRFLFTILIFAAIAIVLLRFATHRGHDKRAAKSARSAKKTKVAKSAPSSKGGRDEPADPKIHFPLPAPRVLTAQEELKTFQLPAGFHAEVVASEPMIETPVAISWDSQGRLYVCEMRGYMRDLAGSGEDEPVGRISRLESTNGDGIYNHSTVFVDKLVMPRAVMALGDGALVGEPPNLVWYHDVDDDGVADQQEIVSSRFGQKGGQPEGLANSPTWMMDNWITSAAHGIRYRLQGGKFLSEKTVMLGQWGCTQDDWGRRFANANVDMLRADPLPPAYYLRNPNLATRSGLAVQVMREQWTWPGAPTPGVNRGYIEDSYKEGKLVPGTLRPDGTLQSATASCGPGIYRGDLFPKEYLGNAFVPEPAGNLVKRMILTENDTAITAANAYQGKEFLTSTDERFRPVNTYTGPDGALYVVDMGRGIIQHKDFLSAYLIKNIEERKLAEPCHLGRIFRIVPDGAEPKLVKLPKETVKLPPFLEHPNGWVRDTAQRLLVERGEAAIIPAVQKIAAAGLTPQARLQALWTLEGLNGLGSEVVASALRDADQKVRAAAVRLAPSGLLPELVRMAKDPSLEVRLHLAFKLSGRDEPLAAEALLALLDGSGPLFGEAAASGLNGREVEYLETLMKRPDSEDARLAASNVFELLAACAMKERNGARVTHLLELIAVQPAGSLRQLALLTGLAGLKAPGALIPPLILDAAPAAFPALLANRSPGVEDLIKRLDSQIVWPGKPGWVPPVVAILTPDEQALFEKGKAIYSTICAACHQPTGAGGPGLAPPLLNSEWVLGQPDAIIRILAHGLTGPITVAGTEWKLEMPALPRLDDEQVASIATYIRREWGHAAAPVTVPFVKNVRAAHPLRNRPWTAQELKQPLEVKPGTTK